MESNSSPNVLTTIPTKTFHNRRYKSQYLKSLFPAGFQLQQVRKELVLDPIERDLSSQILKSSNSLPRTKPIKHSFISWTKGEDNDDYEEYDPDEDPFADCAGPTLQELNALRTVNPFPVSSIAPYIVDPACQVNRCRLYPVNKRTRAPNRVSSPYQSYVCHANLTINYTFRDISIKARSTTPLLCFPP
ncbi:hypothetical protein EON65_45720 [archaeon]|nr:MAG: hypothetical protein EON65_45720 [archaeon]